jgi:2-haloacid dehalogenase
MPPRSIAVFDLGGVLIDWNPRYLYRKLFAGDDAGMELFLSEICSPAWNAQQDAGRPFAEACDSLKLQHPAHAHLIDAWFLRHGEMIAGPLPGTVDILADLRARGVALYALSNWSAETFPTALKRFEFLHWFQGILLSGEARLVKPDPRIFRLFFETFALDPAQAVFIDDVPVNVNAAAALGVHGIHFTDPSALRHELTEIGLLDSIDKKDSLDKTDSVGKNDSVARIDHAAAWVSDLSRARAFYERWFHAAAGPTYSSSKRDFQSCFLSLGLGARLELMASPAEGARPAHLAVSVGSREAVDRLVQSMEAAGVSIISRPRVTGDGYYEAVIADPEGNLLEITA